MEQVGIHYPGKSVLPYKRLRELLPGGICQWQSTKTSSLVPDAVMLLACSWICLREFKLRHIKTYIEGCSMRSCLFRLACVWCGVHMLLVGVSQTYEGRHRR